jgi:hypothetical protein
MNASNLFVLEKCHAADDDSQPYTPYTYATANGLSSDLADAELHLTAESANKSRTPYIAGRGGYKVVTLAEAIKHYVGYNIERSEYENERG